MKRIISILVLLNFIINASQSQSIYELKVKTIEGDSISLKQFTGRKTMFIIVPLSKQDSVYDQLQKFKKLYKDTVNIVGIVSIDDGYKSGQANSIRKLFDEMGIILTDGMFTRKKEGIKQSSLLQWLTDKNKNRHYDNDANGVGTKFFITETGRLFAVLPPQASLQNQIIDRIVHSNMREK